MLSWQVIVIIQVIKIPTKFKLLKKSTGLFQVNALRIGDSLEADVLSWKENRKKNASFKLEENYLLGNCISRLSAAQLWVFNKLQLQ